MTHTLILPAILALLAAIVASSGLTRLIRSVVPLPVVQIVIGVAIGFLTELRVRIDPEIFLLLFLPPLLFLDAWRMPAHALRRDLPAIAGLAFGLVFVTVIGLGLFLHWLLPAMPLALCFALGAVLSPTDAVAVGSIARQIPMPHRMRHILEGEALLNDATALVCLRFATAAWLIGGFSPGTALVTFAWLAIAGIAIGAGVAWAVGFGAARIAARFGEDAGAHILVTLLLPFGAYLLAEQVHASGILASVAAGLTMTRVDRLTSRPAVTRIQRRSTWDMVALTLNGAVFVLLGEQLSLINRLVTSSVRFLALDSVGTLAGVVGVVGCFLLLLRATWIVASLWFERYFRSGRSTEPVTWLAALASTIAGVRGSVTLVAVLTLPRALENGTPLPEREVALVLATGIILMSLALASIVLPPVLPRLAGQDHHQQRGTAAHEIVAMHAAPRIAALCAEVPDHVAVMFRDDYGRWMRRSDNPTGGEAHWRLHLAAFAIERDTTAALLADDRLTATEADSILADLDTAETFYLRTRPAPGSNGFGNL